MLSGFAAADNHQHDSADQTNPAQYRGKRNGFLLFGGCLNWAEIQYFLALGVRETPIRKRDHSDDYENYADNAGRFHWCRAYNGRRPEIN